MKICAVCRRRQKRIMRLKKRLQIMEKSASASVHNSASVGNVTGLINVVVQVPVNLGDANAFNESNGCAANNIL